MKSIYKPLFYLAIMYYSFFIFSSSMAKEESYTDNVGLKGYITNKDFKPIKLRIFEIDKDSFFEIDRDLDSGSLIPKEGLKITAELPRQYDIEINNQYISIPPKTKFIGEINEITNSKSFNRSGLYSVEFQKAICPTGKEIDLNKSIQMKSKENSYSPKNHIKKTTLGIVGGGLAGAIAALKFGGLRTLLATDGYSVAAGSAVGAFIGTIAGIAGRGDIATIQPGDSLNILPVDKLSIGRLEQIICPAIENESSIETVSNSNIDIEISETKIKKNFFGSVIKLNISVKNNSNEDLRLSHFSLLDSQGKEYMPSTLDLKQDPFLSFPSMSTRNSFIEFVVNYPKARHWLIIKNKDFTKELGRWDINN